MCDRERSVGIETVGEDRRLGGWHTAELVGADVGVRSRDACVRESALIGDEIVRVRAGVDRGPGTHVVADVGDRHDEPVAITVRLRVDRIVEVAGIGAVDRDQRQPAQVDARICLARIDVLAEGLGSPKYNPCPLLVRMVDAGWLGRKSGRGFYKYNAT